MPLSLSLYEISKRMEKTQNNYIKRLNNDAESFEKLGNEQRLSISGFNTVLFKGRKLKEIHFIRPNETKVNTLMTTEIVII